MICEAKHGVKIQYKPSTGKLAHNPTGELVKILFKHGCLLK